MKNKTIYKVLSLLLVFTLMLSVVTAGRIQAYAAEETAGDRVAEANTNGEIIAFGELALEVVAQNVLLGTEESELNLPGMLTATVRIGSDEQNFVQEEETSVTDFVYNFEAIDVALNISEGDDSEQDGQREIVNISVPVIWTSLPEYDGNTAGVYTFTAQIEGFKVSAPPPFISVTVGEITSTVTAFEELPDEIRWQNTAMPTFPETVGGIVVGEAVQVPVTWQTEQDYGENAPECGLYVFDAVPDGGYTLAGGVEAPRITVYIPETVSRFAPFRMGGGGTGTSPLEITTADQLVEIAVLVNAGRLESFLLNGVGNVSLKLMNDLDLSAYGQDYNGGKGWQPIGGYINNRVMPFKGNFDGDGYTISGLYINDSSRDYVGLFGMIESATIQNLNLTEVSVSAKSNVGSIIGNASGSGEITTCRVSGSVSGVSNVGGIIGSTYSMTPKYSMSRCSFEGSVSGDVNVYGNLIGGLAGTAKDLTILNSYALATVSGNENVGGLVGKLEGGNGKLQNCYAVGNVIGKSSVGGLAGLPYSSSIENCVALNSGVEATGTYGGRVTGQNYNGTLSGNAAFSGMVVTVNGSAKTITNDATGVDGVDMTAAEIKADGTIGDRFTEENGWKIKGGKLPGFGAAVDVPDYIADSSDLHFPGEGTATSPYLIATAEKLAELAELVNNPATNGTYGGPGIHYKLTADIDLSGYGKNYEDGKGWKTIGRMNPFQGSFDGNGKDITGLYINRPDEDYQGLFGYIYFSTVQNLRLKDVSIVGKNNVGGVAGKIYQCLVQDCYVSGSVGGGNTIGGVAGLIIEKSTMKNCYSTGNISGNEYVGGVASFVGKSVMEDCYSTSGVSGGKFVGGVAGWIEYGGAANCYSSGSVNGTVDYIGGVAGYVYTQGILQGCAALNPEVSGPNNVGRVVGDIAMGTLGGVAFSGMTVNGAIVTDGGVNGASRTADALQSASGFPSAFTTDPWTYASGSLPGLFGKTVEMPAHITDKLTSYFAGGDGSQGDPYQIATAAQLAKLAKLVNAGDYDYKRAYYKLIDNIDLSGYGTSFNEGKGWVPIGNNTNYFTGNFDGNRKIIIGLYISDPTRDYAGLFGHIAGGSGLPDGGMVYDLIIKGAYIKAGGSIGGIVGYTDFSAKIEKCFVSGTVSGSGNVGGVVGRVSGHYSSDVVVSQCASDVEVSGSIYVGGVVGHIEKSVVKNCYATGTVKGSGSTVGGIGGQADTFNARLQNCYATGSVSAQSGVGGIAGAGPAVNCVAMNPSIMSTQYPYYINRVTGSATESKNNYAFSGMADGGSKGLNGRDGADMSIAQANSAAFWTTAANWYGGAWDESIWNLADGKLPTLKSLPANLQSGDGGIYLTERDIANATVEITGSPFTYTGSPIEPILTVTFDGATLEKDKDYTIEVVVGGASDGINAGTVTAKLVGKGNFKGEKTGLSYTIQPKTLTADMLVTAGLTYTGKAQKPTVTDGVKMLAEGTDYTAIYTNNIKAGTANVKVTGKGNYADTFDITFTIAKAPLTITGGTVSAKTYDGTNAAPVTGVSFGGLQNDETLTLNDDYTVTDAQFDSADAGDNKTLIATVVLENTETTNNYTLTNTGLTLTNQTISKANAIGVNQTMNVLTNRAENYDFALTTLLPTISSPRSMGAVTYDPVITANSDGVLGILSDTSGNMLTVPVQSVATAGKTAIITVTVSSTNYKDFVATITVKTIEIIPLTVTGLMVNTKTYDGSTVATLSGTAALVTTNVQDGDEVTLAGTPSAAFDNVNAGTNKIVTITGLSLIGKDAAKYTLDLSGFTGTITAKTLIDDMVTLSGGPFIYTGLKHTPTVTVTDDGKALEPGTDYDIAYLSNINAGTAIVNVTGKGNYTGMVSNNFTIAKAPLTITGGTVAAKTYDGTTNAIISDVTFSGLQNSETFTLGTDYTVTGAVFDSVDAGKGKTVTGTVLLSDTLKTANYTLNNNLSIPDQDITKAAAPVGVNQEIEVSERYEADYEVSMTALLPNVVGMLGTVKYSPMITENREGVLKDLIYTSGNNFTISVLGVSGANKTATITVTVESTNYDNFTSVIIVKTVEKQQLGISGIIMTGGVYNGSPYAHTGTPVFTLSLDGSPVNVENYEVLYESVDSGGYYARIAPANAGEYQLTISVPNGNMTYTGSQSYSFTIEKRPVTVKADDKSMTRGGTLQAFTYTVDGQLFGETALVGAPTFTCKADGKTAGNYPITIDLTGVSYTANYKAATPSFVNGTLTVNNPSSGGSGSDSSSDVSTAAQALKLEISVSENTITATMTVKAAVDSNGNAAVTVNQTQISDAISKAMEKAEKQGKGTVARVEIKVEASVDTITAETSIPKEAINQASEAGIGALTISTPVATITFDANTLSALSEEATGDVKITASKVEVSSLLPEAQRMVGDRPVFDFSVTSGGKTLWQFGGDVTVSVPYMPRAGEDTNAIVIYYINETGKLEVVSNCIYDPATGRISFSTRHFSKYAIGYNKVFFKDVVESAWYSKAVSFIAAREITTGIGGGNFSPEAKLTRGQFIVMLMKAYGIAPDADPKDNFTDAGVTYYTGYLATAKGLSISNGVGNNMFAPDREITRQEMFSLLYNALKVIGRLPEGSGGKALSAFTDADGIASWAKEAMTLLVKTGTISGNGGKLSPTSTTTRAEMAQVLYNLLSK